MALIARHPDVQFVIYSPPYSILHFAAMRDFAPETMEPFFRFSSYATRRLLKFPNVRLHDFRAIAEVTHDLTNYLDRIHHSPVIDVKILHWLSRNEYCVEASDPDAALRQLRNQVEEYSVPE